MSLYTFLINYFDASFLFLIISFLKLNIKYIIYNNKNIYFNKIYKMLY